MSVYLISPNEKGMLESAGDRMPLGILYLSEALWQNAIPSIVVDLNHDKEEVLLNHAKPTAFCFSFMSPTAKRTRILATKLKKEYPHIPMFFGGIHVTNKPRDFLDLGTEIYGYGESKLVGILNGTSEQFDINRYPIPNRWAIDRNRYWYTLGGMRAATMITSRGCPHSCSFCSNFDKIHKRRDIKNISMELSQLKNMGYEAVYFLDDSFTLNPEEAVKTMNAAKTYGLRYRIEARADTITPRMADTLKSTGCEMVAMGIESGDDGLLRVNKTGRQDRRIIKDAVRRLGRRGIKSKGFFIIGLPGETEQTAKKTIEFSEELRGLGLTYADFYPLCPYPGSPIIEDPDKYDLIIEDPEYPHYLNGGKEIHTPTRTRNLSSGRIKEMIQEARKAWKN